MPEAKARFSSKELLRNFGELADVAVRQPVVITKSGRDRLVLVSVETFNSLTRTHDRLAGKVDSDGAESGDGASGFV